MLKRAVPLFACGATLYLLFPVLLRVLSAWPRLSGLQPWWMAAAVVAEVGSFTCTFGLKRLALRTSAWFPVVTAGLVGNAVTNVFPGADATGAAMEYKLLAGAGIDSGDAVGGLTASSVLQTGSLLALPILELPAVLLGTQVRPSLVHLVYLGLVVLVLFVAGSLLIFLTDGPLSLAGRFVQAVHNRVLPKRAPITGLDHKLLAQRDTTRAALGQHWRAALLLSSGRVMLDFGCLLASLAATGSTPEPSITLIAYSSTTILALLPLTPGGLGIVEGSLTGLLVLAGVPAATAALTVLAYRLVSYWLPTLAGAPAYLAYRHRYAGRHARAASSTVASR